MRNNGGWFQFYRLVLHINYIILYDSYFSVVGYYPDTTFPDIASLLLVLLLQEVLSNQKQASNNHWRD